jgi:hypothetical protein
MKEELSDKLEMILYLKEKKPVSLKQCLIRKKVAEVIKQHSGEDINGELPKSAKIVADNVKGWDAEKIAKEHPEWVEECKKISGEG